MKATCVTSRGRLGAASASENSDMHPAVEIIFVWVPMIASVVFVVWFAQRCRREGLSALETMTDRRFMMVFFYTGALLAIYLSTFHFFYFGLQ